MTPNNIAGMAVINGIHIVALTDHNSTKNCRAFFGACKKQGIIPIAGVELTTAEDIHIISLFRTLEDAERFDNELQSHRILYSNRTDIFGEQIIMDENDNVIGTEEYLLSNATDLSIAEAVAFARGQGGFIYPAHIDRDANGIISALGDLPEKPDFSCVEFHDKENISDYVRRYSLSEKKVLVNSDAHYLWDINEAENFVEIEDEQYSSELVRSRFFDFLEKAK